MGFVMSRITFKLQSVDSLGAFSLDRGNFRPESVLGEGHFGCVFKGWVDENSLTAAKPGTGMVIAVKTLHQEVQQGHKEWLMSISSII
ncbi:Kinase superfamily protein [Pyrus ussuriensis x Pyrus communis]|uniref:Kinase superfamily protein n=1 Tax=Pyrus ussuriensis x Pyrus communis TaxID=2448454 RepID=A0A5N5GRJ2_9ROSA|nr:Kinase superfamily protein [Pyrus ussuriensis x Pyrus communis]